VPEGDEPGALANLRHAHALPGEDVTEIHLAATEADPDDIFFGIVQRGAAMIMFKDVGVDPVLNYTRDIKQGIARWHAYLHVPDPDAFATEFLSRDVEFYFPIKDTDDGLRGDSNSRMLTPTSCFSAVLDHERTMQAA
jgi:hypothetical protein